MVTLPRTDNKNLSRFLWGTFLCALLLVFAMATKTALYQTHHRQVQTLTAAKVWQGKELSLVTATHNQVLPIACVAAVAFLLFARPQQVTYSLQAPSVSVTSDAVFSPPLAVRPPPSIQ